MIKLEELPFTGASVSLPFKAQTYAALGGFCSPPERDPLVPAAVTMQILQPVQEGNYTPLAAN